MQQSKHQQNLPPNASPAGSDDESNHDFEHERLHAPNIRHENSPVSADSDEDANDDAGLRSNVARQTIITMPIEDYPTAINRAQAKPVPLLDQAIEEKCGSANFLGLVFLVPSFAFGFAVISCEDKSTRDAMIVMAYLNLAAAAGFFRYANPDWLTAMGEAVQDCKKHYSSAVQAVRKISSWCPARHDVDLVAIADDHSNNHGHSSNVQYQAMTTSNDHTDDEQEMLSYAPRQDRRDSPADQANGQAELLVPDGNDQEMMRVISAGSGYRV